MLAPSQLIYGCFVASGFQMGLETRSLSSILLLNGGTHYVLNIEVLKRWMQ
jgi:hypothetical protein